MLSFLNKIQLLNKFIQYIIINFSLFISTNNHDYCHSNSCSENSQHSMMKERVCLLVLLTCYFVSSKPGTGGLGHQVVADDGVLHVTWCPITEAHSQLHVHQVLTLSPQLRYLVSKSYNIGGKWIGFPMYLLSNHISILVHKL